MFKGFIVLFLLFIIMGSGYAQCPEPVHPDYNSLMKFYDSTNGPSWTNKTGWEDGKNGTNCNPCNGWHGITCDVNNRVGGIVLKDNELSGNYPGFPYEAIFENLVDMDLSFNRIEGNIGEINSPELLSLNLSNNSFTGFPLLGFNLPKANIIDLSNNNLTGCLPEYLTSICSQNTTVNLIGNPNLNNSSWSSFCSSQIGICDTYGACPKQVTFDYTTTNFCKGSTFEFTANFIDGDPKYTLNLFSEKDPTTPLYTAIDVSENNHTFVLDPNTTNIQAGKQILYLEITVRTSFDLFGTCRFDIQEEINVIESDINLSCTSSGSTATINFDAKAPPYDVSWTGPENGLNTVNSTPFIIPNLSDGKYTLTVSDADACGSTCEFEIGTVNTNCTHPDFEELMKLYKATGGANWTNNTGWKDGAAGTNCDPCTWYGIKCDSGRVVRIEMDGLVNDFLNLDTTGNNLVGVFPELKIEKLKVLNLSDNKLTGSIKIDSLTNLESLMLAGNRLTGQIPEFKNKKLQFIFLQYNQLSGNLPKLSNLDLKFLDLGGNYISGEVLNYTFPNLEGLYLGSNRLADTIPNFSLPKLKYLWLAENELSGRIPLFNNAPNLEQLVLFKNQLNGNIPLLKSTKLKDINFHTNQLSGSIPSFDYPNLVYLNLSKNDLEGCIPYSLEQNCNSKANIDLSINPKLLNDDWSTFCSSNEGICDTLNRCPGNYKVTYPDNLCSGQYLTLSIELIGGTPPFYIDLLDSIKGSNNIRVFKDTLSGYKKDYLIRPSQPSYPSIGPHFYYAKFISKNGISCSNVNRISSADSLKISLCPPSFEDTIKVIQAASLKTDVKCGDYKLEIHPTQNSFNACDSKKSILIIDVTKPMKFFVRTIVRKGNAILRDETSKDTLEQSAWWFCDSHSFTEAGDYEVEKIIVNAITGKQNSIAKSTFVVSEDSDYNELQKFYTTMNGNNWTLKGTKSNPKSINEGWNKDCYPCNWYGITCDQFNRVIEINLPSNNVNATLSSINFQQLKVLNLAGNKLSGSIPNFKIQNIEEIYLDSNDLSGTFPDLEQYNKLKIATLSKNNLGGNLPPITHPTLEVLWIRFNKFNGPLPELSTPKLKSLRVNSNNFSGCIPQTYKSFCFPSFDANFSSNPNLASQSWKDYCTQNDGMCIPCASPILLPNAIEIDLSSFEQNANILSNIILPKSFKFEVLDIKNDIFNSKKIDSLGVITFLLDEHFFTPIEIIYKLCNNYINCDSCSTSSFKIYDKIIKDIVPTNIISPNNDGRNDLLRFNFESEIADSELQIYNRWGDRIYHKINYTNDWDANGYPGGVYFYVFNVRGIVLKNSLTIIK